MNQKAALEQPESGLATCLLVGMAGAMGWGIRGQYGHETGAMIAGVLVSLTILLGFYSSRSWRSSIDWTTLLRAAAWGTLAIGFGGSMTYGQTIGLTQDQPLIGNWSALAWGMLGLAIKGGLWIAFAGAFFGMGLCAKPYRVLEVIAILLVLVACFYLGIWLFNRPFDPANHRLPYLYFSDDWRWEPEGDLKPRAEVWGGYALGFVVLTAYLTWRNDRRALHFGLWGLLGGGLGFPLGQSLQATHAWNVAAIQASRWSEWDRHINWWNWMETTFGFVMGFVLAYGVWRWIRSEHRSAIHQDAKASINQGSKLDQGMGASLDDTLSRHAIAMALLSLHVLLLLDAEFAIVAAWYPWLPWLKDVQRLYDHGLNLAFIPIVAVSMSRWASLFVLLPLVAIPIVGKTFRELAIKNSEFSPTAGWIFLIGLPMLLLLLAFVSMLGHSNRTVNGVQVGDPSHARRLGVLLMLNAMIYFWLNLAFFRFPWPWLDWSARTSNGFVFALCTLCLILFSVNRRCY